MQIHEKILKEEFKITDFINQNFKNPSEFEDVDFRGVRGSVRLQEHKIFRIRDLIEMIKNLLPFK